MKYILAVDGGGTNTVLCAQDLTNGQKTYIYTGSTNYKSIGIEEAKENLKKGFNKLTKKLDITLDDIRLTVLGLSGLDSHQDSIILKNMVEEIGFKEQNYYLCNDSELALYAGAQAPAMVLISGTGSIVFGINEKGKKARVGGWDYILSDLGSGFYIGKEALTHTLMYFDGYHPASPLFPKILKASGDKNYEDLVSKITVGEIGFSEIASFAKVVVEEAKMGEKLSLSILDKAVKYLTQQSYSVYKKLDFDKTESPIAFVLSGGVIKNNTVSTRFKKEFMKIASKSNIKFIDIQDEPVVGGLKLALKMIKN